MADKFIEFIIEDEGEILRAISRQERNNTRLAKEILNDLAKFGLQMLYVNAPSYSTYILRHASKTDARFRPGGAGGGGEFEAIVGIKSGTSRHPIYVEVGTGLYGEFARRITPTSAPSMTWFSTVYGKAISKKSTKGQKPQRYFYETWKEVEVYARVQLLGNRINPFN